jgi:formate hydrogenlyase subunit 6/NADH:ubiquinone oxidoreductase subunit I
MTERYQITQATLEALFSALAAQETRILAPRQLAERIELAPVATPAEIAPSYVQTVASAKGVVFPKVEQILGYRTNGKDVVLEEPEPISQETVVFGIRPCEARAFAALDALFNWDYRDQLFNARLAKTTVVAITCTTADEACFCTSLGSGPEDPRGSDLLLHPLAQGGYAADVLTEKGEKLVALVKDRLSAVPEDAVFAKPASLEKAFDGIALGVALAKSFDAPIWEEQSLRCLGCGACAFVCPTCACFDIQDERAAPSDVEGQAPGDGGRRLRCWDSCGLRLFTLHASGHNPRERQSQRWRQRVYHKFAYYPERLGMLGCVGCGKCSRACPVDMNLREHLAEVVRIS